MDLALQIEELFKNDRKKFLGFIRKRVKSQEEAEDILQEGFIKIWDKADSYTPGKGRAMTWMSTVIRNKGLDKLRSLKTRPSETEAEYEGLEFASADLKPDDLEDIKQKSAELCQNLEHALCSANHPTKVVETLTKSFGDRIPKRPDWVITLPIAAAVRSTPAQPQEAVKIPKSMTSA